MIRSLTRRFLREEDGIALVMALAAMTILAITTTGVIISGTVNEGTTYVSMQQRSAFAVAQEALAYGEGMVYSDVANSLTPPTTLKTLPTQPNGATGTYQASVVNSTTWHIDAWGYVGGARHEVSANVTPSQSTTTLGTAIWNYLYEDNTNPGCLGGSITISMSILTRGNFCIGGSVRINGANTEVEVGGTFTASSAAATVGSASGGNVAAVEIAGTPSSTACNIHGTITAPGVGACSSGQGWIYANTVGTTLDTTPQKPPVNFPSAYAMEMAGTQTGCAPGGKNILDNDSTMNLSNTTNISSVVFGATAYDCKVVDAVGTNEIKWTPPSTLYVHGELYFDGSLNIPNGTNVYYTGLGSLYFTGGVTMKDGVFCGISTCSNLWDTTNNAIVFVTDCWNNSTGTQLITGTNPACVDVNGHAEAQFAAWVNTTYNVGGNALNMGPVLCDTFVLNGSGSSIIPLKGLPVGIPTNSTTTSTPGTAPTNWSG